MPTVPPPPTIPTHLKPWRCLLASTFRTDKINSDIRANVSQRKRKNGYDDDDDKTASTHQKPNEKYKKRKEKRRRDRKKSDAKRKALIEKKIDQFEVSTAEKNKTNNG